MLASIQRHQKSLFDLPLLAVTAVLILTGLVLIYDVTPLAAMRDFGDKLFYFKNQLIWATLGIFALIFLSFFDYHRLVKLAPILMTISAIFLTLVLIPQIGTKVYGARRWISFAGFTFQPSEFTKLALILYETFIISKFEKFKIRLSDALLVIFTPALVAAGLTFLEPDLGTSLILILLLLITYFIGHGPLFHFILIFPTTIALVIPLIISTPYRLNRIKSYLDPISDPQGASYQISQILKAIAAGGIIGVGIGGSTSKFNFIPEIQSDSIFAIFVEETGFIGAFLLITAFVFLIKRALTIAKNAPDFQGRILSGAIAGLLLVQTFFNIASNIALIPLTGVPLPFISYGGSSLFVTMAAVGILLNIKRQS